MSTIRVRTHDHPTVQDDGSDVVSVLPGAPAGQSYALRPAPGGGTTLVLTPNAATAATSDAATIVAATDDGAATFGDRLNRANARAFDALGRRR